MDKFKPASPDPFIVEDEDMYLARLGHLNALVDAINSTIPAVGAGVMFQSQYDPFNTGIVNDSFRFNSQLPAFYLSRANHTGTQAQSTIIGLIADLASKGDMFKIVYDTLDNGVVNDSRLLEGLPGSYYLDMLNFTGSLPQASVVNLVADLASKQTIANLGITYAPLSGGLVPLANLPFAATAYLGLYDGATNTPVLANGVGIAGQFLITSVAGAAGPMGAVVLNQVVAYNGAIWEAGPLFTGGISSVNGNAGPVVVLDLDDIPDSLTRAAVDPNHAQGLTASFFPISSSNPVVSEQEITNLSLVIGTKGDMFKATYDINNNGVVDNSERLGNLLPSFFLNRVNHTGFQAQSTITNLITDLNLKEDRANKGIANGYCDLDAAGKVPLSRLTISALNYQNSWNAFTNTPSLADGVGTAGDAYLVGVAGTRNLGSGSVSYAVGDLVIYNGTVWQKITFAAIGVSSWNGLTGSITATTANLPDVTGFRYVTEPQNAALDASNNPSALNPYITQLDLSSAEADITTLQGDVVTINANLALKENKAEKGIALGYVPLNASVKIDPIYLPSTVFNYQNSWDALTNTPVLADGVGTAGDAYIVGTAGTQNLGSGNITFAIGDLVIYNGTIWQKITGAAPGVSSVNGFTGAVTLTADNIAETASRFYINANQNAGIDAAPITGANRVATMSDLAALVITASGPFSPELFADGQTLGDGTLRTLGSLGYTNPSAALIWPKVAADVRFTIDVATMSIDWIAWQEACLTMELEGYAYITTPGGRGYCFNQSCLLPRDQVSVANFRRSQQFTFDFNSSAFSNQTGTNFRCFDKYPVDQTEANGLRLVYQYFFSNGRYYGNDSSNEADCFIRLGATSASTFTNITMTEIGIGIDAQFCLQVNFDNINVGAFGVYGITCRDGLWSGASANIAQSNNVTIHKFHAYTSKANTANIYCQGNRNIDIYDSVFEGGNGSVHHIFYEQLYPANGYAGTVKNCLRIINCDWESSGATRAGIRINGGAISLRVDGFNIQQLPVNMPCFIEAGGVPYAGQNFVHVSGQNSFNPGWKFRQVGIMSWEVEETTLNDNTNFIAAANWLTDFGGTIPSTFVWKFTPPITTWVSEQKFVLIPGDVANANPVANTLADVTGLQFPVVAGRRYVFKFIICYFAAATTTGSRWSINGPGGSPIVVYKSQYSNTATTVTTNENLTAFNLPAAANNASGSTLSNMAIIEGFMQAGADGFVVARFASEIGNSAITAKSGSIVYYHETYI